MIQVYQAAQAAVDRARRGEGPTLIECDTYRLRGHHEGDEQTYRTKEEVAQVRLHNDCILRMCQLLREEMGWTEQEDRELLQEVERQVEAAVEFARNSPPMAVEDMEENLFISAKEEG